MTAEDEPPPPSPRKPWKRKLALATGVALVVSGAAIGVGPAAPWVADQVLDGRRIWRLGDIRVDGVRGSWLGDLRAEHIELRDGDGVWIEAHDVALDWRPLGVLFGDVNLTDVRAARIVLHRQPTLSARRPSTPRSWDIRIGALQIDRLDIAEAAFGEPAQLSLNAGLDLRGRDLRLLDLNLQRLDSNEDRAVILYRPDGDYALNAEIVSAPSGILARALGVGEQGFRAEARGNGSPQHGEARYLAIVGDETIIDGVASWTPERWRAQGQAHLSALPSLETLTRRIGANATFSASGERVGAIEAQVQTEFLTLNVAGAFNAERELEGGARFTATTRRLSDIAREAPFEFGAARLEGELRQGRGTWAIRGTLDAQEIDALGQRTRLTGPIEAALLRDRFTLNADLRAPPQTPALFAQARLRTDLVYDRERGRFALNRATLEGDALNLSAQGWARGGAGEFSGDWRVRRLEAVAPDLRGAAGGQWRAFAAQEGTERIWTTRVIGAGERIAGAPDIVPQLLGATPRIDAMLRNERGGITVSHARLDGARLRAGVVGRIVQGDADLRLEATARGPLNLGGATIDGALDATGRIRGRISRPSLSANAVMSSFNAGGVVITQPNVAFTLAPNGRGYAGQATVQGQVSGQPVEARSGIAIANGAVALSALEVQVGGLRATGEATIAPRGVTAQLEVNGALDGLVAGVTGRIAGDLALTPQTLTLEAQIADARAGDLRVRAATISATGPYDSIAATFNMRGRLREAPLAFEGTAGLDLEDNALRVEGRGALAEADIFTRAPITATWGPRGVEAALNVAMGDGVVMAQWQERGRALSGSAQIEDAPLAPLAAIWGERATGRIDGRLSLSSNGGGLAGDADLRLEQARFAGRQRGVLEMRIIGALTPTRVTGTISAVSSDGLTARLEADAPVVTDADPIRIALAPERRGRATWTVHGPADSLWAAARLPDQSLEGQLDGEGELQFGAGYLSGAGHIEIVDGRFEDKLTGVTLVNLDARIGITDNGVQIESFTAEGPRGGRMTATGGSNTTREGRVVVTLDDMRVADRPDARARASGQFTLAWEGLHSRLDGDLNIIEASIDIASNPEAGIPTMEVIEINRPGEEDEVEETAPRRNGATALNVRVRAPGRVFTRGRGAEVEWALDLRLAGTSRNPQVFGAATAVRGTIALSGQPFDITEARIVFNGDPLDASIDLTAERDTADLTAYIHLTGTARRPEISFTSDPGLPDDEILPQILFGRSVEDLSPLEAAQLATSLAALSGRASLDFVDAARAAAGLDRFNVREDEAGGFLVAGGVYLTREVYVEVARTGLGQAQTRVEWTIRPRMVLITSFLGNGDQRVSLRWRRESD